MVYAEDLLSFCESRISVTTSHEHYVPGGLAQHKALGSQAQVNVPGGHFTHVSWLTAGRIDSMLSTPLGEDL